ncbi:MAG: hypothetical protein HXX11_08140 [Desulfuromonadales bacterium]|nr:hypothetical protein [Desulfuromonadales bacterium]
MYKKLTTIMATFVFTMAFTGSALAAIADLELIRVVYERTTGTNEQLTDLGSISTLLIGTHTIAGDALSAINANNLYAGYFAINRTTKEVWATSGNANAPVMTGTLAYNTLTNTSSSVYNYYSSLTPDANGVFTGVQSNLNSYRGKMSASQGRLGTSLNATSTIESSLASLVGNPSASPVSQTLYYFINASTTNSVGVPVGTITTNADGSTTITASAPTPVNGVCGSSNTQAFDTIPTNNLCSAGSASAVTGSGPWSWSCAGQNGGTAASCSASIKTYPLSVTFSGNGSGSVNSDLSGINCTGGSGTTCSPANFNSGVDVVLTATESFGSVFNSWSGTGTCTPIQATQSCKVNMSAAQDVIATFDSLQLIKLSGTTQYYGSLQGAFDDTTIPSGDTIQAQAATFSESSLTLNRAVDLSLMGGYDPTYASNNGYTTIHGQLVVRLGSLIVDRIIIM